MSQGFAQWTAPHAETLCQLCLVQLLALCQFARDDAVRQTMRCNVSKGALFWNLDQHRIRSDCRQS
jgi:hypothetical protein